MWKRALLPVIFGCLASGFLPSESVDGRSYPLQVDVVHVQGLESVAPSEIRGMIETEAGVRFVPARARQDARLIREAVADKGRPNAKVTVGTRKAPQGGLAVRFDVEEGDPAPVGGVVIAGNTAFSDEILVSQMHVRKSGLFSLIVGVAPYDEREALMDEARLATFYAERGYPEFEVLSNIAEYDPDRQRYFVTLLVREGLPGEGRAGLR